MNVKTLREKALARANAIEAKAVAENKNCLLMPAYQTALQVVAECDNVLFGRTDKAAEERADELNKKLGG